jgi:hypothetical protein
METLTHGGGDGYSPDFPSVAQSLLWPDHNNENFNYIQGLSWLIAVYQQTSAGNEPLLHKPR